MTVIFVGIVCSLGQVKLDRRIISTLQSTFALGTYQRRIVSRSDETVGSKLGNVNSRVGRIALIIVGVILLLVGAVFAGQGANLIPGSSMTGDRMWLYIGLIVAIVGIVLIVLGLRRPRRGDSDA
jgi:uncharacterized membrane protein YidH (DUF202 family)